MSNARLNSLLSTIIVHFPFHFLLSLFCIFLLCSALIFTFHLILLVFYFHFFVWASTLLFSQIRFTYSSSIFTFPPFCLFLYRIIILVIIILLLIPIAGISFFVLAFTFLFSLFSLFNSYLYHDHRWHLPFVVMGLRWPNPEHQLCTLALPPPTAPIIILLIILMPFGAFCLIFLLWKLIFIVLRWTWDGLICLIHSWDLIDVTLADKYIIPTLWPNL